MNFEIARSIFFRAISKNNFVTTEAMVADIDDSIMHKIMIAFRKKT